MPKILERSTKKRQIKARTHPLLTPSERGAIWARARGLWSERRLDPIKDLKLVRDGWDRKLPSLSRRRGR